MNGSGSKRDANGEEHDWCDENSDQHHAEPTGRSQRPLPSVPRPNAWAFPDAVGFPEASGPIDGRQRGGPGSDTVTRHHVNLDAGLLKRPKHTCVVGAMRAGPAQHKGRATLG